MKKYGSAKQAFFDVGLDLLEEQGYEKLSVAQICKTSASSNGSFFHHFGSKQQFVVSLYALHLASYQRAILASVADANDLSSGIAGLISSLIEWVESHTQQARFLLNPPADLSDLTGTEVAKQNREFYAQLSTWYQQACPPEIAAKTTLEMFYFQVIGPVQMHSKIWLANKLESPPSSQQIRFIELANQAFLQ